MSVEPTNTIVSPGGESDEALSVYGRVPLLLKEREYGTLSANGTCFAYAIATWCFLTGGYAAQLVGAVQGLICLVAGNIIGVFLISFPLSLGCQRYGLEQIDACKPSFGQYGARIVLIFYLLNMLGWSGLILVMFGNGIQNIIEALGYQSADWVVGAGVALGIWLSYVITTRGIHLLNIFNSIISPALILIVTFMFYMLITAHGWDAITAAPPIDPFPDPAINYAIVVELGIASGMSWWGGIGFLARNTKTRRNAIYPEVLQLGLASGLACSIALFSGLIVGSDDPTEWMVPLGGIVVGVLALAFVALANITSTVVSVYASGLALRHIPGLHKVAWWKVVVVTMIPLAFFVIWPQELYGMGDAFLAYNGTMHAPVGGILFVDYFFIRKQRINLSAIYEAAPSGEYYYWKGFNMLALGGIVIGQVAYFLLYNPFTDATHWLFTFLPASIAAFVLPALIYWFGMHFWLHKHVPGTPKPAPLISPNI
jgi:NCS1 family nucleobase:cation symporter-1